MNKRYRVTLNPGEREELRRLISSGRAAARKLTHARILLQTDESEGGAGWVDQRVVEALGVGVASVQRVRKRFVEEGLEAALVPRPSSQTYSRKLDGEAEAHLIATACSDPPAGRSRWSLRLLAEKVVALGHVEEVSHETVRQTLKKTSSSPG